MTIDRTPLLADGGNPSEQGAGQKNTRKNNTIVHTDSQPQKLLAALGNGPVSTPAAIYGLLIPHPANAIHRLRSQGHFIVTALEPMGFPDGETRWAAQYRLLDSVEAQP